jgi:steroid delta-isomerase-like uncharacterized protein
MGEAKKMMEQVMAAIFQRRDMKAASNLYASDAVAMTPDQGEIKGAEEITAYIQSYIDAFPDAKHESIGVYEDGNVAVDEGMFSGTNTGEIQNPTGENIPATGRSVSLRGVDIITVENGTITRHNIYFDQMGFLAQLGLIPEQPS